MTRTVKIGAATAFFNDSRMGIGQLLEKVEHLDYIIFDFLAESVMGGLGRGMANGSGQGFAADFADGYILPHLPVLLDQHIRIVANAGGLNPVACAEALRIAAEAAGFKVRIGVVEGDNLTSRASEIIGPDTHDMFDGSSVHRKGRGRRSYQCLGRLYRCLPDCRRVGRWCRHRHHRPRGGQRDGAGPADP